MSSQSAVDIVAVEKLGSWIALSGMFGSLTQSQGAMIAFHCLTTGTPPFEWLKRNQLVGSRLTIPYDAMVAAFQQAGGQVEVIEKSPEAARFKLHYLKRVTTHELTWEQARKEPFAYSEKGKSEKDILAILASGDQKRIDSILKSKYASPRSRAVMLWARCISDAIRTVCPEATFGYYTPEEAEDIPGAVQTSATATPPAIATAPAAPPTKPAAVKADPPATTPAPTATAPTIVENPPTEDTPPWQTPAGDDLKTSVRTDGPATEAQRTKALQLIQEIEATAPGTKAKIVTKLTDSNIPNGIRGLSIAEADHLIAALEKRAIALFFEADLRGAAGNPI